MNTLNLLQTTYPYLIAAFLITLVICKVVIRVAPAVKLVDVPKGRKNHEKVTPLGGGIGIFVSMVVVTGFFVLFGKGGLTTSISMPSMLVVLRLPAARFAPRCCNDKYDC